MNQARDALLINVEGGTNKNPGTIPVFSRLNYFRCPRSGDRV